MKENGAMPMTATFGGQRSCWPMGGGRWIGLRPAAWSREPPLAMQLYALVSWTGARRKFVSFMMLRKAIRPVPAWNMRSFSG